MLATIETADRKPLRLTLADLTDLVAASPGDSVAAVELLLELLENGAPAVQAEALGIPTNIVDSNPEAVRPAIDPVLDRLSDETRGSLRSEAIQLLAAFAEHDPEPLTGAVPRFATLLHDDGADPTPIARMLATIARSDPDALLPVVPKLERYLETEPQPTHAWVLMAVGHLSKAHPGIAKEAIPIAAELIDTEDSVIRSNAAGVLADLADEYPTAVKPIVPRAIELLQDDDDNARYNASSILARAAEAHPDAVEPATEQLLAVLDDERADTRLNACWALTRIDATTAIEKLTAVAAIDPDEDVRGVAQMAVDTINE